jgi:hypothetical protein
MFKLLKLTLVVGALAAVWMLVPVRGRTLEARWRAAGSPEAFAVAGWSELRRAFEAAPPAKPRPQPSGADKASSPAEQHTERDRQAVDRIVAEHLKN